MKFKFDTKKAAQAAHLLLQLAGGRLNYLVLIKLLYLSDRTALLQLEAPITGDRLASLPFGPVVSHILDLIKWGPANAADAPWFDAVSPPIGYDVKAVDDPGTDELSNAEVSVLKDVFQRYSKLEWWELSDLTHELPEWIDPKGSSVPISPEQILRLEGRSKADIERIERDQALLCEIDHQIAAFAQELN
jgi:uncharacterized phage-associated protein